MSSIGDHVALDVRRHRSTRIDADAESAEALAGYVLQSSVGKALWGMADALAAGTRAFTWTGPYGGGKSTAALVLAGLFAPSARLREVARSVLPGDLCSHLFSGLGGDPSSWTPVAVVAQARPLREELVATASRVLGWSPAEEEAARTSDAALIARLDDDLSSCRLLLVIDELGRSLEGGPGEKGIHLLQDLAEWASRSNGRVALVGVLHRSLERHAARQDRATRDDWAKVQGRFMDVPFVAASDEMVSLVARAIKPASDRVASLRSLSKEVAEGICRRRPGDAPSLSADLSKAWPLNPVTTLLLGPLSRRRFAQNERSVFGFLASAEPLGFRAHLSNPALGDSRDLYGPDRLWDYVQANFGTVMRQDEEGHRLTVAIDAIERAEARGGPVHARVAKCCAALEFFGGGTGLVIADEFVLAGLADVPAATIVSTLDDLVDWAILTRQHRLGGYAIFAGSDFDLDAELSRLREDLRPDSFEGLPGIVGMATVAAKRHYFRTGALRTFPISVRLATDAEIGDASAPARIAANMARAGGSAGRVLLLVCDESVTPYRVERFASRIAEAIAEAGTLSAIGIARSAFAMRETAADLVALERMVREQTRLEGDRLARREVAARRSALIESAHREVVAALDTAKWRFSTDPARNVVDVPLSTMASMLADAGYPDAPLINSELLQRDKPSSNAMAAVRELGHAMAECAAKPDLGIEGYPAAKGLYVTVLAALGLHRKTAAGWRFVDPDPTTEAGRSLQAAWAVLHNTDEICLSDVYDLWGRAPFGMKRGVMPIIAFAQLLACRASSAIYLDGIFQSQIDDVLFDRLLQDPGAIRIKRLRRGDSEMSYMNGLRNGLSLREDASALDVASALFRRFAELPEYARRTTEIDPSARAVRDVVLRADDPEALLFCDLPRVASDPGRIVSALDQSEALFERLLATLTETLSTVVGADPTFAGVTARVDAVVGTTGDLRFDAFAQRLKGFEGGGGDIEGLASMLVHRPARSWSDLDRQRALSELARFGRSMREAESLLPLRGRSSEVRSIALVLDLGEGARIARFSLTVPQQDVADTHAAQLMDVIKGLDGDVRLAALARAVEQVARDIEAQAA